MIYLIEYVFQIKLKIFNMITGKNESKFLSRDISRKCKFRFDGKNVIQINGEITINVDVSVKTPFMWKRLCLESC